jgi:hypothetical protein
MGVKKKKPEDEQQRRMRLYEQSFTAGLVSRHKENIRQAEADIAQAIERGDTKALADHEWTIAWNRVWLEHLGTPVIDGSIGYLALPERKDS